MKLIATGMRFLAREAQDAVKAVGNFINRNDSHYWVKLEVESNKGVVDGMGVRVVLTSPINQVSTHVAYIRNADLRMLFNSFVNNPLRPGTVIGGMFITSVRQNYLIIEGIPVRSGDYVSDITNSSYVAVNKDDYAITTYASTSTSSIETKKESTMNTNSIRDSLFREVKNIAIDFQSGKFGVKGSDGISVYDNGTVVVNPLTDLGMSIPAFAMRIAISDLKEGDIVISGNDSSFFKSKTEAGYEVVTLSGEVKQIGSVSNLFFGKNTVLAVKNMFGESSGMNPMMLALMMGDDKKMDTKTLMLMSMMQGSEGMNPMMMALLMAKD